MKRPLLTAIVVGLLAFPSAASAVATQIQVGDDFYAPDNPPVRNLSSGASFTWVRAGNGAAHNVRQDFTLFNSGGPTSGPINFSIRASAGTFHYYCTLHGSPRPNGDLNGRMDGVVRVRPISGPGPTGPPFTVLWGLGGTSGTNTGNQFDVRYRVGVSGTFGVWKVWKNDVAARSGVFGQNNQPVQVLPGRMYQFQARSQKSTAPSQASGWSPIHQRNT